MKKMLFSAAALFCSFAALAQAPAATAQGANNQSAARKVEAQAKRTAQDRRDDNATAAGHGQAVSALAQGTTLTGAEKGAAISTLASGGRSAAQGQRTERGTRGERAERTAHSGARGNDRSGARGGNRPAGAGQ